MHSTIAVFARRAAALLLAPLLLSAAPSHAQLRLDITQGVRDAVPIAVVEVSQSAGLWAVPSPEHPPGA